MLPCVARQRVRGAECPKPRRIRSDSDGNFLASPRRVWFGLPCGLRDVIVDPAWCLLEDTLFAIYSSCPEMDIFVDGMDLTVFHWNNMVSSELRWNHQL